MLLEGVTGEAAGPYQLESGRNSCRRSCSNGSEGCRICCPLQGTGKDTGVLTCKEVLGFAKMEIGMRSSKCKCPSGRKEVTERLRTQATNACRRAWPERSPHGAQAFSTFSSGFPSFHHPSREGEEHRIDPGATWT